MEPPVRAAGNPAPCDVQMPRAGRSVSVERHRARLPGKTERLLRAVADIEPLPPGQPLARSQPDVAMKKSCRRLGAEDPQFFQPERRRQICRREAAQHHELGKFAVMSGDQIAGQLYAVAVQITFRDHDSRARAGSRP